MAAGRSHGHSKDHRPSSGRSAQDGAMTTTRRNTGTENSTGGGGLQVRSGPLVSAAALVGVGGLIALVGIAIGGFHLLSAGRQWVSEMGVPPTAPANHKLAPPKTPPPAPPSSPPPA